MAKIFIGYAFLELSFTMIVVCKSKYYMYLGIKEKNKLYLCQENFQVIVNNLNNAIISETEKEHFAFCNELGLNLVKTIW